MKFRITAIMCTYNGLSKGFLREAMASMINQTRLPDEIIIINDGSTDGTAEFIANLNLPNCKIYNQIKSKGLRSARNTGIVNSTGDLIAFLDDDDLWEKDCLEKTVRIFEKNPAKIYTTIVHTGYKTLYKNVANKKPIYTKEYFQKWPECLFGISVDGIDGVLLPRTLFEKIGPIREEIGYGEDLDFWNRALRNAVVFEQIKEPLFYYRKDSGYFNSDFTKFQIGYLTFLKDQLQFDLSLPREIFLNYHLTGFLLQSLAHFNFKHSMFLAKQINIDFMLPVIIFIRLLDYMLKIKEPLRDIWRKASIQFLLVFWRYKQSPQIKRTYC